ncbi:Sodium/hydrogen exchanger 9B2 [Parelaphostrongylus tenuis]|uniref:Sodium/hydrogen exchanger 9B2 n=1 Tax=Parelaphostrongylus tenuis TaxID=148309 RepID=A0AAD5QVT8_PARTN|nr:Sodium/hydrogen exchanger 9B2 [Parelaphostrongylus tenuis]
MGVVHSSTGAYCYSDSMRNRPQLGSYTRGDGEKYKVVTLSLGILTAAVESCVIAIAAIFVFGWSIPMAFTCGFVLTAVSPAVIVPVMLELQSQGLGTRKGIPTLVLASAALDNIFCITAFSVTVTIVSSSGSSVYTLQP